MQEVVVDASVIVKWFVGEEDSDKALKIRDRYIEGEIRIITPDIITYEILNALYHKRIFSEGELCEVSEALDSFLFNLYPLKGEYAKRAVTTSFENDITVYDSAYISLAIIKNTYLYTSDDKLIGRLKKNYLKYVKNIKDI